MPATRTATASARCTSIRWRVFGHCSAPGCVRIAASRRRSCQSISASLSSCTTRAGAEKPCSVPLSLLWSGDALHHPGSRQEPLRELHARVHRGAYRPQPSRRRYIPKADGGQRPLAVAALEDKIVQRATAAVLNQIYEEDFLGFSYGFRPGRSQHDAL